MQQLTKNYFKPILPIFTAIAILNFIYISIFCLSANNPQCLSLLQMTCSPLLGMRKQTIQLLQYVHQPNFIMKKLFKIELLKIVQKLHYSHMCVECFVWNLWCVEWLHSYHTLISPYFYYQQQYEREWISKHTNVKYI